MTEQQAELAIKYLRAILMVLAFYIPFVVAIGWKVVWG